jgi:hypothetical protein
MSSSVNNIKINPVNVLWQIEASEQWDFTGSTAAGIGGKYITLYKADGTGYYVWWDENNTDTDPAPSGLTAVPVDYAASASLSAILTATQAAMTAIAGFDSTLSGNVITSVRTAVGAVTASTIGTTTSVILTVCRTGKNLDLGLLQGNVEPSVSPANLDIKAHQFGTTPLASLSQGFEKIECKTVLLETDSAKLKELYSIYGGSFTPGGGTQVFGAGSIVLGRNILSEAARLVLRPVNAVDNTTDVVIMLCIPVPESLSFSGENPQVLNVTWKGFIDTSANSKFNALAFGDVFQDGL